TIAAVYNKRPNNLFFQFLLHRYVNNAMHPLSEIRDRLLNDVPDRFFETDASGNPKQATPNEIPILDMPSITDIAFTGPGDDWAWRRDDPGTVLKSSGGWDVIFLANLLQREFNIELDDYKANILPGFLKQRRRELDDALQRLADVYTPMKT